MDDNRMNKWWGEFSNTVEASSLSTATATHPSMCSFIHAIIYSSFLLYPGLCFQSEFQSSSMRDRNMMFFLLQESPLVTSRSTQMKPPYISIVCFSKATLSTCFTQSLTASCENCLSLRCSDRWTWETREWQWWRDGMGAWDKKDLPFLSCVTLYLFALPWLIACLTSAARCHGNTAAALESWVGEAGGCYLVNTFAFLHWI